MIEKCKRCLLLESGEVDVYKTTAEYLSVLDEKLKVSDIEYQKRLKECKNCDFLISGMCRKCGCYVEIRAALKEKHCPNVDNNKW